MGAREMLVKIVGDPKGVLSAFKEVEGGAGSLSGHMGKLAGSLAGAVSVGSVVAFGKSSIDAFKNVGSETKNLQRLLGDTSEEASRLRYVGEATGVSTDVLAGGIKKLSKAAEANSAAFAEHGISVRNADGSMKDAHQILLDTADVFASMPDGVEKNALAMKLFGKTGTDIIPVLNRGKEGIAGLEKESDKYGLTLTQKNMDALKKSTVAHREIHAAMEGVKVQIGEKLMPVVATISQWFAEHLPKAIAAVHEFISDKLMPTFRTLGDFLQNHTVVLKVLAIAIGVALVSAFVAWAASAATAAVATIAAAAPIIAVGVAIGALVAGVIYAYKHFGWFRDAVNAVRDAFVWVWHNVLEPVKDFVVDKLVPAIVTIVEKLVDWGAKAKEIAGKIIDDVGKVVSFVEDLPHRITKATSGMWDGIKDAFRGAINWLIQKWNDLSFTLPSIDTPFGKIGGYTLSTPNIPLLATGGRALSGGLAIVGEKGAEVVRLNAGDAVYPHGTVPAGMGGGATIVHVHVAGTVVAERDLVAAVRRGLIDTARRVGVGNLFRPT